MTLHTVTLAFMSVWNTIKIHLCVSNTAGLPDCAEYVQLYSQVYLNRTDSTFQAVYNPTQS